MARVGGPRCVRDQILVHRVRASSHYDCQIIVGRQAQTRNHAARRSRYHPEVLDYGRGCDSLHTLVVDIGGTSVKILATGQTEARSFPSGPRLTPARMASGHSDSIALYSGQLWI